MAGQPQVTCPSCASAVAAGARFCGSCGAALSSTERAPGNPPAADDLSGREIAGRYRLSKCLGQGGMGAVYRAEQISLKRTVAIKLLKAELSDDPALVRRFNAEAELAAKLNHPNTVTLFDFGQDHDGSLFIAMELVDGQSLRQVVLREGPLPVRRVLHIAQQVGASLADAHAHGIVHRDLKPDNVMLSQRGRQNDIVRVLDFGIAKLRDERGDVTAMPVTQAGDLLGTPQYMAPEQIRGETVDGRTDVYALGIVIYEMVTGRLPFEGPTVMAILGKHLTDVPPSPSSRRPDLRLPPELDGLVMQALEKAPARRPPSMEAYCDRMSGLVALLGAGTGAPLGMGTPRRTTRPPGVPLTIDEPDAHAPTAHSPRPMPMPMPIEVAQTTPAGLHHTPPSGPAGGYPSSGPMQPPPLISPPPAQLPYHGQATPVGAPYGYQTPAPAPPRRSGLSPAVWIPILIAVTAGIAVTAVLLMRSSDKTLKGDIERDLRGIDPGELDLDLGSLADDSDEELAGDQWAENLPEALPAPIVSAGDIDGSLWTHPNLGYQLIVPPGFSASAMSDASLALFEGSHGGYPAFVGMTGQVAGTDITEQVLRASAMEIIGASGGQLVEVRRQIYQGAARWSLVYDQPTQGTRWEVVLYGHHGIIVAVAFGVAREAFDSSRELRSLLFERRTILPR